MSPPDDVNLGALYKKIGELQVRETKNVVRQVQRGRSKVSAQQGFLSVERCSKPTIAAVQGQCIGGGMDFVTACDIRLASMDAEFRFE